jgi:nicotinate-nucleotide adenylyltransferase
MRVLMGGSFDPVHEGHLHTAETLRQQLALPQVSLLPAACSPLKPPGAADHHRLAMLQLAVEAYPGLVIDDRELRRPPPSFTIDTLRDLRTETGPEVPLAWVMGADTLGDLANWKDWEQLPSLAHLIIVDRPGYSWPIQGAVYQWLERLPCLTMNDAGTVNRLQCTPCGCVVRAGLPPEPASSTAIRAGIDAGICPPGLPAAVWQYILDHHPYPSAIRT